MTSFHQHLTELTELYKKMEGTTLSISIEKSADPTKRTGNGWKVAISTQVAMQFAKKEILIVIGPTSNGYYYR